jgi:SAM-dependent methyltransferase
MKSHFDVASYTDLSTEARFRAVRVGYFQYLCALLAAYLNRPLRGSHVLDIGTSYGHFLERLGEGGAIAEGVEIVAAPRHVALERGLIVHDTIPNSPATAFDAVTMIDSLYYTNDPLATLQRLKEVLTPGGCLLIRVTNRTWLLDLMRAIGIAIHRDRFGDAKHNFSPNGILLLLRRAGFLDEDVVWEEKGKADPRWLIQSYYRLSPIVSEYLALHLTPGMLVVARSPK